MKFSVTVLFFLVVSINSNAQKDSLEEYSNEYNAILRTANNSFDLEDYYDAIVGYKKILEINPYDKQAVLNTGISLLNSAYPKTDAIPYLQTSVKIGLLEAKYYLAKAYHLALEFDSARKYFENFRQYGEKSLVRKLDVDRFIQQTFVAQELISKPIDITIKNVGMQINSESSDYSPLLNADQTIMYYTSKKPNAEHSITDSYGRYFEDIYFTIKEDSEWSEATNIGLPINSKAHDATVALSADGSFMVIYRTDAYTGMGDLYFSERTGKNWSMPVRMGMNINSPAREYSATLSADAQIIYFSSDREGGVGGLDIYKSVKNKNGVWGKSINLGKIINTDADEDYPFLYANGKDLYFSSKGHAQNMGGYDIFKTYLNELGNWTNPVNMGYPLNTTDDDLNFVLAADGKNAYFCSSRKGSIGELDIFTTKFKNDTSSVCVFKGTTIDEKSNKNISATITIEDKESGLIVSKYKSESQTGEFMVILPENKTYKVTFEHNNMKHIETIEKQNIAHYRIIEKLIKLSEF